MTATPGPWHVVRSHTGQHLARIWSSGFYQRKAMKYPEPIHIERLRQHYRGATPTPPGWKPDNLDAVLLILGYLSVSPMGYLTITPEGMEAVNTARNK
jgi:hypothetical protein